MKNKDLDIEKDIVIRLARKYGSKIKEELVFGDMEYLNLAEDDEIVYRYEGNSPQRSFCKEMIRLNKFYTKEEINLMSLKGKNRTFGHNKQNYSIWKYKGGISCRHKWVAYTILRNKRGKITQSVKIGDAKGLAGEKASGKNNFFRFK